MGLNPNLNIEDEYIQNLVKQVHFLNMEIKLIKEKQKDNKGMGIMGLLNKDKNPVVTHAITSNAKFSEMKNTLTQKVNLAQADNIRLDDQNYAVKAQRDFVEKLSLKEEERNIKNKMYVQKELLDGNEKLKNIQHKLNELKQEFGKTSDYYEKVFRDWDDLTTKDTTKKLILDICSTFLNESQGLRQKHFNLAEATSSDNRKKLEEADRLWREDQAFKKLMEENTELKDKVKRIDRELFEISYKAKGMEELKKLSIRNRDVESDLKKQAVEECERLSKKLTDKKAEMDIRLKESKGSLEGNDEVRLLKNKLARRDKEITELKKKTELSQNNYKRLRDEVKKLQLSISDKKEKNSNKQEQVKKLTIAVNDSGALLRQSELDFQKNEAELKTAENSLYDARKRLEGFEQQLAYLQAKEEYLTKEIDLDQGIKNVKINELTALMQSNSGLNNTISDLMSKWEQIVKYSRQPPA